MGFVNPFEDLENFSHVAMMLLSSNVVSLSFENRVPLDMSENSIYATYTNLEADIFTCYINICSIFETQLLETV